MKKIIMTISPLLVLALAIWGALIFYENRPKPTTRVPETPAPIVRIQEILFQDVATRISAQGTVSPRTEISLFPEVPGRVVWISPSMADGGFFETNEVLLKIDPRDFKLEITQAKLQVARAELQLAREDAEAEVARKEWKSLGLEKPSPLTLREPQLAEARALVESARASLRKTELDLERTELRAQFSGRVRQKMVDIGQVVTPGSALATLYSVDFAEVRLPISYDDLAYVNLPVNYRGENANESGPSVTIRARLGGRVHSWVGRIVRTDGEIDPRTRLVHAIAQVENPYGRGADPDRPPLAVGLFVTAEIEGKTLSRVATLPRSSVRGEIAPAERSNGYNGDSTASVGLAYVARVLVVDRAEKLHFRKVRIVRIQHDTVLVSRGLEEGDQVCLTMLEAPVEGMTVRVLTDKDTGAQENDIPAPVGDQSVESDDSP